MPTYTTPLASYEVFGLVLHSGVNLETQFFLPDEDPYVIKVSDEPLWQPVVKSEIIDLNLGQEIQFDIPTPHQTQYINIRVVKGHIHAYFNSMDSSLLDLGETMKWEGDFNVPFIGRVFLIGQENATKVFIYVESKPPTLLARIVETTNTNLKSPLNFIQLQDVPIDYTGMAGATLVVNQTEDGISFQTEEVVEGDLTLNNITATIATVDTLRIGPYAVYYNAELDTVDWRKVE